MATGTGFCPACVEWGYSVHTLFLYYLSHNKIDWGIKFNNTIVCRLMQVHNVLHSVACTEQFDYSLEINIHLNNRGEHSCLLLWSTYYTSLNKPIILQICHMLTGEFLTWLECRRQSQYSCCNTKPSTTDCSITFIQFWSSLTWLVVQEKKD